MKNDSQVKYYAKKLLGELNGDKLLFEYSTDILTIVALKGEKVVKKYNVVDRQRFMKPRRCTFDYLGKNKTFNSITEAAKKFGIGRTLLQYYMNNDLLFYETKKGTIVKFVKYEK